MKKAHFVYCLSGLNQAIATVDTNEKGRFPFTLGILKAGVISAIATHSQYGTSEPVLKAVIRSSPPSMLLVPHANNNYKYPLERLSGKYSDFNGAFLRGICS